MTNFIMNKKNRGRLWYVISIVMALTVWQIVAMSVNLPVLLPSPFLVLKRIKELSAEGSFWRSIVLTSGHILRGFGAGLLLGVICAVLANLWHPVEILLKPYILVMKSVPVAAFIIVCLLWLKMEQLTSFIAFLMVFPILYSNVLEGIKASDGKLLQMAAVYRIGKFKQFLFIHLQGVKPYLLSGIRVAVGTAWKAGVAAEVIGLVNGSIGANMYDAKVYLLSEDLFAWTVVICVLSVVTEKLICWVFQLLYGGLERL